MFQVDGRALCIMGWCWLLKLSLLGSAWVELVNVEWLEYRAKSWSKFIQFIELNIGNVKIHKQCISISCRFFISVL